MVKLRLKRMGKIDKPFYRIVAVDSRKKRDGIYLEAIGHYDPKTDPLTLKVDIDNAIKWLNLGAQPSDTVKSLFRKAGVMEKWHNQKFGKTEDKVEKEKTVKAEKKEEVPLEKEEVIKTAEKPVKSTKTKTEKPAVKKAVKKTVEKTEKKAEKKTEPEIEQTVEPKSEKEVEEKKKEDVSETAVETKSE